MFLATLSYSKSKKNKQKKHTFVLSILLIIHEISYYCITGLETTQLYQVYSSVRQAFSILIIGTSAYNSKNLVLPDVFFSKGIQRLKYFGVDVAVIAGL